MDCAPCQAFWDGTGHVYYALIGIMLLTVLVIAGQAPTIYLSVALVLAGGVFADLMAHGYTH